MSDRSVVDTIDAFAVEAQDYVRFVSEGTEHEGFVLSVDDNGDTVTLVLSDDLEGDTVSYEVGALDPIEILSYVSLEVA